MSELSLLVLRRELLPRVWDSRWSYEVFDKDRGQRCNTAEGGVETGPEFENATSSPFSIFDGHC